MKNDSKHRTQDETKEYIAIWKVEHAETTTRTTGEGSGTMMIAEQKPRGFIY